MKRWCLAWRTPAMPVSSFWYFATKAEASAAASKIYTHATVSIRAVRT